MLSEFEIILTLKNVSLFTDTPDDVLGSIVPMLEEIHLNTGDIVFHKGDPGDSMYILAEGEVRVHDDDMTLNFLGKRSVFGEMAALDPEPRSATVTATCPTTLFRLDQVTFYKLMTQRTEVLQGVLHVLCQHLRARMSDLREDYSYMQQFAKVTAAAIAVESGVFEPESLNEVVMRTDELGQLARVFQRMTREVYAREQRLRRQVQDLRIEVDEIKQHRQVEAITETDYFQRLQRKAANLRRQASGLDQ